MDFHKAKKLEQLLSGQGFKGYTIENLINHGKSAAVFKGTDTKGNSVAIKIFDDELIGRLGQEVQEKRILLEQSLIRYSIEGLIKIIDGGKTDIDGYEYFYIIMEFVEGSNLKDYIENNQYSEGFIIYVFKKLIQVTEELLKIGIVHRDIKPENIMVNTNNGIILMDLGVMKEVGHPSYTDIGERQFLGTLRYASPEFLIRTEEDNNNGWRALNLYQIGAVLHDLIMKRPLYIDKQPYGALVLAIREEAPNITNPNYSYNLIQLARNLLTKDWKKRLEINNVNTIIDQFESNEYQNKLLNQIERIRSITGTVRENYETLLNLKSTEESLSKKRKALSDNVILNIGQQLSLLRKQGIFDSFSKSRLFGISRVDYPYNKKDNEVASNCFYYIVGDLQHGFSRPLYLLLRVINDDSNFVRIYAAGFFISNKIEVSEPEKILKEVEGRGQFSYGQSSYLGNFVEIFNGVYGDDEQTLEHIGVQLTKLIAESLKKVVREANDRIDAMKNRRAVTMISNNLIVIDRINDSL